MDDLFLNRPQQHYPPWLYQLVGDMFAVVQYWQPSATGACRGRLFESVFHRYCNVRGLLVSERPGARTIRHERSASGFSHESDGVLSYADLTVHLELKHLSTPLGKNDLLVFNQKGLDYLAGGSATFRRLPLYRVLLSGEILSPEARQFALQWGIIVVEPDRLPLIVLHDLVRRVVVGLDSVSSEVRDEIWLEIPLLLSPLQQQVRRLSGVLDGEQRCVAEYRLGRALDYLQRVVGDRYWMTLDAADPQWLERRFDVLCRQLALDGSLPGSHALAG